MKVVYILLMSFALVIIVPSVFYFGIKYGIELAAWIGDVFNGLFNPLNKRKYVAIEHADRLKEFVINTYCKDCEYGKDKFGEESPLIVRVRKNGKYIFYTHECMWERVYGSNIKCGAEINRLFDREVFNLYKNSGGGIGSVEKDKIRYAIDNEELFENSYVVYVTKNKLHRQ